MASPGFSEIVTTTLKNRKGEITDQTLKGNALLLRLMKKGKVKPKDGGESIVKEIAYQENSTFKRYSGYETLNIAPSDVLSAAEYAWKQAAVAISMSGLEQLQNSGKNKLLDLIEERISNAEITFKNNIAADVYSNGTADGGKQIGGLQLLVADTPTSGTVGGIDRSVWAFWQNIYYSGTSNGGAAVSAANIQRYLRQVMYQTKGTGNDGPDLIVMDNNYYDFLIESYAAISRITDKASSDLVDAGFQAIKFMGADAVLDGGFGGNCPSNHAYVLNTNYIEFNPHRDRYFVPLGGNRESVDQDAFVKLLAFAGNMTLSCAKAQGVLKA